MDGTGGTSEESVPIATVTIAGKPHRASEATPVVFGRADGPGLIGLDPRDMGISAVAGSIEWKGLWFVVNRSRKRRLYIDDGAGGEPQPLDSGRCHPVNVTPLTVRVRGEIYTHKIGVTVPDEHLVRFAGDAPSTGTILAEIQLTNRDRDAAVAMFEGYLLAFPRHQPWPRTYEQAAHRLGSPWTKDRVRKQIERLKIRLSRAGPPFDGPRANHDLAEYLIANKVIGPDDLSSSCP
jgi:hypothetical protein